MKAAIGILLDAILPRRCALCGAQPLGPSDSGALCRPCAVALRPWEGERCPSCGLPLISEEGSCMRCRGRDWSFDRAFPLFPYSGAARELIRAYKKGGRRSLALPIAAMADEAIAGLWPGRVVVPVPPRPGKIARLGWDQVEEIAAELGRLGRRIERPLVRKAASEQKRLGRRMRAANARASYSLKEGAEPPPDALLIDDVITTGATVDACAAALKAGGARSVVVLAIAAD